jgi:hypothetical protein
MAARNMKCNARGSRLPIMGKNICILFIFPRYFLLIFFAKYT